MDNLQCLSKKIKIIIIEDQLKCDAIILKKSLKKFHHKHMNEEYVYIHAYAHAHTYVYIVCSSNSVLGSRPKGTC